jgi:nitrite reductase/ring-hydroxylating ferredoxin subunit
MPGKSSTEAAAAPPVDRFPQWPASWYLFGPGAGLGRPVSRPMLGRRLVAFRASSGQAVVLDAACAHLGADLGHGRVVGDSIQCPFHHWRYGADGRCTQVPGQRDVPPFARLRCYPVEERHGLVFFFNGPQPLFPLPFILGEDPSEFVAGPVFRYVADCTWYMNSAHAFDRQHFAAVHDRKLIGLPAIDCPAPFCRRNSYDAEVVGRSVFDRLLRVFAGRTVRITLTVWGGTFAVITADFGRVESGFLMSMLPLEDGRTQCAGIVLARRSAVPPFDAISLRIRRVFTYGYLADEARRLRGTHYRAASLTAQDQDLIDFFDWVAALPQSPSPPDRENPYDASPNALAFAGPHLADSHPGVRPDGRPRPQ